jgi:Gpi18-like mannosyltransferase
VESLISEGKIPVSQALELYEGMGDLSSGHYSNYPPLNQLCFVIAGLLAGKSILGSVIVLRMLIIAADFGTLYFGKKLLKKLHIPAYHIFWYILNPFTIIELTGNLHFEGVMVFFLVWSLYLLYLGKWPRAAVVFALSVSVKLIPLIFLPLFFQWFVRNTNLNNKSNERVRDDKEISIQLRLSNLFGFYGIIGVITLILFLPFYHPSLIDNYSQTIGLWFQNFEFNASFYYIAREIGYIFRGYNEIAIIGSYIPWVVLIFVLGITLLRKNIPFIKLMSGMLLALSFYYFTSTTIHPWYLVTLLALSVFTKYKFPLAWSFVIIFSYLAYVNTDNIENLWVIGLEYLVVYAVLVMDLIVLSKKPHTKGH